jgi:hypothetical protein
LWSSSSTGRHYHNHHRIRLISVSFCPSSFVVVHVRLKWPCAPSHPPTAYSGNLLYVMPCIACRNGASLDESARERPIWPILAVGLMHRRLIRFDGTSQRSACTASRPKAPRGRKGRTSTLFSTDANFPRMS